MKATTDLNFYHLKDDGTGWEIVETATEIEGYVRIPERGQHINVGRSDQLYVVESTSTRYRTVKYSAPGTGSELVTEIRVYLFRA